MLVASLLLVVGAAFAADWKVVNVERNIDISSQIVKVSSQLTLANTGSSEANSVEVLLSKEENEHLSYISAQEGNSKGKLKVSKQRQEKDGFQFYKIELLKQVEKNGEVKLRVEYRLTEMLKPFPEKITQKENQYIVYNGNAHYASPYPVAQEKTTVKVGSGKTISATQVNPTNQENERVIYGPYKDQPAFNKKNIKIHYENNSPFVVATVVERTIEISHWGNIAVEEYIELVHKGAELKGPFSRIDHQLDRRGRRQPALLQFTTILPASAKDIYYRDEIGNISTSSVRLRADSVDVDIKPRFPLFGGWRTSYIIGYNVPSYEYLYNKGNDYALKMRVLDHVFDNIVVEKLTTKIILPEMVKKVRLTTPYTMDRRPDEVRATYLDTFGRTVIVLQKENLVPEHIQSFTLFYEFEFSQMIREPLIATAFFFALFTAVIIYVRFDFTIVADPVREARERIQGKVSSLAQIVDKKNRVFSQFLNAVNQYKSSRDLSVTDYGVNQELNLNASVTLGSSDPNVVSFVGSITRVHVWNRILDFDSEIPMMVVTCHGNELSFNGLLLRFSGYTEMQGKVERIPRSSCGREKRKRADDAIIRVENCPPDQHITTTQREVNVTWPEPIFTGVNPLVNVERNFNQGQVFTWGEYDVLYVAHDNSSNTVNCNFKIHISREHCPSLEEPMNGVQACETWGPHLRYKACSIECREGYEFSRSPAIFYTCAADGVWRPRNRNQMVFRYPQCTKSLPATRVMLLRVSYPGTSPCSEASKDALRSRLLSTIHSINQKWDICSLTDQTGCVGTRIDVDCSEDFMRVKRSSHMFNVRIEVPVKRDLVSHSVSGQKSKVTDALQNEIINGGAFNLEKVLPSGRPDLSSFQLLDEFHCQMGQVTVGDMCVPCAPGSYHSLTTSQCELCMEGEYQPLAGRTECFKCSEGQITAGEGAISENECKESCPAGNYFDLALSRCAPCGYGFFQPRPGAFECVACDVGKTTMSETAVSEEECRDECPDGEHLSSSGSCQPCPAGSYRTRGEHKQCVQCPDGTTTESVASTRREQCNTPRCKVGQFLVKETKHCQFCPRGTFQDEEQRSTCKLCPADHTTASQGATAESQCYSTNQCATGEDNCSWHAHCIDLPDDNDVPSFQCKCKPGYRGNGTFCQDACTNYCLNDGVCKKNPVGYVECACKENFSGERCEVRFQPKSQRVAIITAGIGGVVAVLVVIVIVIFMISFRFNRTDTDFDTKLQVEDMQQSNFLYGRTPIEPPRPIGYYYEDDEEYESKTMYVTREDDSKEIEQRRRIAEQHMYRPGQTE